MLLRLWVEARDTTKHPTAHSTGAQNKELPTPKRQAIGMRLKNCSNVKFSLISQGPFTLESPRGLLKTLSPEAHSQRV